jgi:segregation and condensation protein B
MTIQDHDNEMKDGEEISFSVESNDQSGNPVFPDEPVEAASMETESVGSESLETDSLETESIESESIELEFDSNFDSDSNSDSAEVSEEVAASEETDESDAELAEADVLPEELTLAGKIEAIVFASPKPMRAVEIHELLLEQGYTLKEVQDTCDELIEFYRDRAGGFHLRYIKRMGYQFQTTTAAKQLMEKQFSSRPRPLSKAALETLAVIAYRQKQSKGVTRAEVEFIRGVDAGSIFKTLVERNLLTCVGRKEIPGRPMMFGVTDEFLKVFQLGSINDLPPLESFQTPQDILEAANQKILDFEAEQEGVDTEKFIGDEEYTAEVQSPEVYNPLDANAPVYAPSLERVEESVALAETSEPLEASFGEALEASAAEVTETVEAIEPAEAIEPEQESKADLIDVLNEGQVAWDATDGHTEERSIQGATVGEVILSMDAVNEDEWDQETDTVIEPVTEPSEAQSDERNETAEVVVPAGDSEPPRGGEVDQ